MGQAFIVLVPFFREADRDAVDRAPLRHPIALANTVLAHSAASQTLTWARYEHRLGLRLGGELGRNPVARAACCRREARHVVVLVCAVTADTHLLVLMRLRH